VYFNVTFVAGQPGMIVISGNGNAVLDVVIYDSDGHVLRAGGFGDRKVALLSVYRTGVFRVEVWNYGPLTETFALGTN
jgi:hypothetical protein